MPKDNPYGSIETNLINTVDDRKYKCTAKDYLQSQLATKIQNILGILLLRDYFRIVNWYQL